jgi:hypothetical protein
MEANMKRPEICLLILVMMAAYALVACAQGGPAYGRMNCSSGGEVCIIVSTAEPINFGEPIKLMIKVTSSKDISNLHVTLQTPAEVTTDDPQNWENYLSHTLVQPGYAGWDFAIKAGQTLTFNRVLHLPAREDNFLIGADVITTGRILVGTDSFYISMTHDGGKIYHSETPLPTTRYQVVVNTFFPTISESPTFPSTVTILPLANTSFPTLVTNPTPTQFVPLVATSTHTPYPGPTSYP